MMTLAIAIPVIVGIVSAALYARGRQWINAVLVLLAAAALGSIIAKPTLPAGARKEVTINGQRAVPDVSDASVIRLEGDGLRAAQWPRAP